MSSEDKVTPLVERVKHLSPSEDSAEYRILDFIRGNPSVAAHASASTIGQASGTSDASVIRTVKKLGYEGMRDFRDEVRESEGISETQTASQAPESPAPRSGKMTVRGIYAEIREMILTGTIGHENFVTESQLASMFGVSRTPIREAIRMLSEGGIVVRDHRGISTPKQTPSQVNELYDAQILLQGALARRAAERRNDADLHTMRTRNQTMRDMPVEQAGSVDAKLANSKFHESIYDAARDRTLGLLVRQLTDRLDIWSGTTLNASGRWEESLDEHDALIQAIQDRDSDEAKRIVAKHLETARRLRLSLV